MKINPETHLAQVDLELLHLTLIGGLSILGE